MGSAEDCQVAEVDPLALSVVGALLRACWALGLPPEEQPATTSTSAADAALSASLGTSEFTWITTFLFRN